VNPCELCKDIPYGTMTSGCANYFGSLGHDFVGCETSWQDEACIQTMFDIGKDFCKWGTETRKSMKMHQEKDVGGGYSHGSNINNKPKTPQLPPGYVNPCELCKDIPYGTMTSGCANYFGSLGHDFVGCETSWQDEACIQTMFDIGKDFCRWGN